MSTVETLATPTKLETGNAFVEEISLDQIQPSKTNPRRRMDGTALAELAANIRVRGVLQPILVRPFDGACEIVCGERRWRASKSAGRETIPARIMNLSDAEAMELAVINARVFTSWMKPLVTTPSSDRTQRFTPWKLLRPKSGALRSTYTAG